MGKSRPWKTTLTLLLWNLPGLLYLTTRSLRIADWERFDGPHHGWLEVIYGLGLICSPIAIIWGMIVIIRLQRMFRIVVLLGVLVSLTALSFMALEYFDSMHGRWGAPLPSGATRQQYWWWSR